jgi:hypothetical protein
MRYKTILCGTLAAGLLAGSAGGEITFDPAFRKPKAGVSTVKLVTAATATGKQILVLSGQKTSFPVRPQKAIPGLAGQFSKAPTLTKGDSVKEGALVGTNAKALAPGGILMIGPTGVTTKVSPTDTLVVRAPLTRRAPRSSANPLAATVESQVFAGDLPRDASASSRDLTPGSVAESPVGVVIGPNGFPTFTGASTPSGTNPIGPNGFPEPTTTGAPSAFQPINPNGFPAMNAAPLPQVGITPAGTARDTTAPAATSTAFSAAIPRGTAAPR